MIEILLTRYNAIESIHNDDPHGYTALHYAVSMDPDLSCNGVNVSHSKRGQGKTNFVR
jgi:hypothetical protein